MVQFPFYLSKHLVGHLLKSVPFGIYWRIRPFVFSFAHCSQEWYCRDRGILGEKVLKIRCIEALASISGINENIGVYGFIKSPTIPVCVGKS